MDKGILKKKQSIITNNRNFYNKKSFMCNFFKPCIPLYPFSIPCFIPVYVLSGSKNIIKYSKN
jgi:hypothetical protein